MLEDLKSRVLEANLELVRKNLVIYTWGNVSGIDRKSGLVVIKPSGVDYDELKVEDMVVVDLQGKIIEGHFNPSSDTPTHLVLYKDFKEIGGVVHTHSEWATSFAQAGLSVPAFGTTHADYFYGEIPCTRAMIEGEIKGEYEKETGNVIVETFKNINPLFTPGVLVNGHGPFSWGKDCDEAVYHSVVMEQVSKIAFNTINLKGNRNPMDQVLLDKHFFRKHGKNAYYGQK
ncbi:L-ribulose-5-phosphate 4-epimerase [Clostridium drakei]|uniref:L-ribulose-5-phosphate 4-epimerase n=1 Tax=Clostridium drakei TaxID=332101 RepID=A0A2U8DRU3_9CLOT|nr:L-ribulose-5-phosphate 4-epimerase [Clostridium drakei]AWI05350.1 L-ribulose-5-phosphate 4-epimerase [Clostridium drakei]